MNISKILVALFLFLFSFSIYAEVKIDYEKNFKNSGEDWQRGIILDEEVSLSEVVRLCKIELSEKKTTYEDIKKGNLDIYYYKELWQDYNKEEFKTASLMSSKKTYTPCILVFGTIYGKINKNKLKSGVPLSELIVKPDSKQEIKKAFDNADVQYQKLQDFFKNYQR